MKRAIRRWWWAPLLAFLALGFARLRFDVEVLNLLPDTLPAVQGLKLYQKHFSHGDELILTLRASDPDAAESAARQLAGVLRADTNLIARALWQPPWREHPEDLAELIACLWLNQPTQTVAELTQRLAPGRLDAILRDVREQLATTLSPDEIARSSYDPFGLSRLPGAGGAAFGSREAEGFASPDGLFRVVFVEAKASSLNYRAPAAWLRAVQAAAVRCAHTPEWPAGVTVRFTGGPAFVAEIAGGMERDIRGSALATLALIAGLFWWAHRGWRPLLWLLAALGLVIAGTLAAGGWIFGELNAVSLGFAAILLGLAVDYGLVLYQETVAAPHLSAHALRRLHTPGILWSAVTTASAFALLNFAGLPGLSQLGSLIALGTLLAAVVMLYGFLPVVLRGRSRAGFQPVESRPLPESPRTESDPRLALAVTALVALVVLLILSRAWPPVDSSVSPLQPRHSAAQAALDEMQKEMNRHGEPLLLLVSGRNEDEVARRLDVADAHLAQAALNRQVHGFQLPTRLWPRAERQRVNLTAVAVLAAQADELKATAARAGFTADAMALAENVFRTWGRAATTNGPLWPASLSSQWLLRRAAQRTDGGWLAAGSVQLGTNTLVPAALAQIDPALPGVWLTAWPLLGDALWRHVEARLWWMLAATIALIAGGLWMAFRRATEMLLSFATLGFSLLALLAVMGLAGWSWNLMNLMALPLLLGAGVDYTIHVQLALRRHAGDARAMRRVTGRAVFLCAATTVAGFGSNALSSNAGLASLGLVCATGMTAVYLSAVFLLPAWWRWVHPDVAVGSPSRKPSTLYRAEFWSLGLLVGRRLPAGLIGVMCRTGAAMYYWLQPARRTVVMQNLLPVLNGNHAAARRATKELFREFALKLADLWRLESGVPVDRQLTGWAGWEIFTAARAHGRGVLLVTPHLGNWEFGGAFFAKQGCPLLVLTQPEPQPQLTALRQASRARRGIETLVIGEDAFAFVEIIKRLQAGATVALLVDRPPPATAVTVELFERPFQASIAAAELARASGCAIVPSVVVRQSDGYLAEMLPEIAYDRAAVGDRNARIRLTQEILRAFEPSIRQHAAQWFHFVPLWPDNATRGESATKAECGGPQPQHVPKSEARE